MFSWGARGAFLGGILTVVSTIVGVVVVLVVVRKTLDQENWRDVFEN
jgi:uncharacterized membrane protein YdjX (TVP38/TMEM64 family)